MLFKGRKIFSKGFNKDRFCSLSDRYKNYKPPAFRHAEVDALFGVDRSTIKGSDMFVVRIRNNGELVMSKPCQTCQRIMTEFGIRSVYYSDNNGEIQRLKL